MKTLLIIDDSGTVLRSAKEWFQDHYNVIVANSGKVGLRYLENHRPDLIILDIMMPDMDGFETFGQIRQTDNGANVPIVFLTGTEDADRELEALELGASDFVRKPIQPKILMNRIDRILSLEDYNHHMEELTERLRNQLENLTLEAIMTIAATIDAKDTYTRGHSDRVATYSVRIGEKLGLSQEELDHLHILALLHDIGKIGIPDAVLLKAGRLTDQEFAVMKTHTTKGAEILQSIQSIDNISDGAHYHHERYDGSGYPQGLKGEAIPMTARIIAVADAYDAMTTNRVYREHLSQERVKEELVKGRGSQLDPQMADAMLQLIEEHPDQFPIK